MINIIMGFIFLRIVFKNCLNIVSSSFLFFFVFDVGLVNDRMVKVLPMWKVKHIESYVAINISS